MSRTSLLRALLCLGALGLAMASFSQMPAMDPAVGDPVPGDPNIVVNGNAPTSIGDPSSGIYDAVVSAYISSYACVSVYDNYIKFRDGEGNEMDPVAGAGTAVYKIAAGATPIVDVPDGGGFTSADLAGGRIETNTRLDFSVQFSGNLERRDGAVDTRKDVAGQPYELWTEYKVKLKGKFLSGNPADNDPGTAVAFKSPSSDVDTDYNTFTPWSPANDDLADNAGWLHPFDRNAWTGLALGAGVLNTFDAVVERGQANSDAAGPTSTHYGGSTYKEAAEWWIAERVLRRGLNDVAGNYQQDIWVSLTFRECPEFAAIP